MLMINLVGLLLVALVVWWFWLYKAKTVETTQGAIKILVEDGSYQPSRISLKAGEPNQIEFVRKDASPCAAMVIFPDLDISQELMVNETTSVDLPELIPGEYPFHCQMQMYKGTVIVK